MTEMSDTPHVLSLISDYVLELLPSDETALVQAHLSNCPECRRAVATERQVGRTVRATLHAASTIDQVQLRRSMPQLPVAADPTRSLLAWSPRLATVGIFFLIIGSAFVLYLNQRAAGWSSTPPAAYSTAVIMTDTPTMTATSEITATIDQVETSSVPAAAPPGDPEQEAKYRPAFVPIPSAPLLHRKDN